MQRPRGKSKGKEITCFQCGRKGHKKHDCRFYKNKLERKKKNQKATIQKKDDVDNNKGKEKEKENTAFGVIIEDILDSVLHIAKLLIQLW